MNLSYRRETAVDAGRVADLYRRSGIRRPHQDLERIRRMVQGANLVWCAWDGDRLVGIARSLTDFSYACYLSDLAVDRGYQGKGIGTELIRRTRASAGDESMLLLLSAPEAASYYAKVAARLGMEARDNAWFIPRTR